MTKKTPWISIEGVDGAGKSSHVDAIVNFLRSEGYEVVSTREPGGTPLGERLRAEILRTEMALATEVLLSFASRAEHMDKIIRPALSSGQAVVCDRFTDSTFAYQGAGKGYSEEYLVSLEKMIHGNENPDLTIVFDLPATESLRRLGKTGKDPDKFESQDRVFFERVRSGYFDRAKNDPSRVRIVSSEPSLEEVSKSVLNELKEFMKRFKEDAKPTFKI